MERATRGCAGRSATLPTDGDPSPNLAAEPRQRWRIVFARPEPSDRSHRELAEAWIAALEAVGLPLPRPAGRPKPPLSFAAPLPNGVAARRELADLWVAQRLPVADVRRAVVGSLPAELVLVDLHDVWLGAPALAAALVAAEYRVDLADIAGTARDDLVSAAARLLAAPALERTRARAGGSVRYDLRPLVDDVSVQPESPALRIRTRFHPERGAGRPEEVLAALAELGAGDAVARAGAVVRERLVLDGE